MLTFIQTLFPFLQRKDMSFASATIGGLALVLMVISGSTSTVFAKILAGGFSPLSLLFVSEFITLAFTVLSFGLVPLLWHLIQIRKIQILPLILTCLSNSVFAPILVFIGLRYTNAVNAELFLSSNNLFMFLLAIFLLNERITRTHVLATSAILCGILIVALRGFTQDIVFSVGDAYILGGSLLYASGTILFKMKLEHMHPEVFIFSRGLTAMVCYFLSAPFMEHTFVDELQHIGPYILIILLCYGFISRFVHLMSFYEAIERVQVHIVSLILPLSTIGSLVFAHFYLGDVIAWYHILGAICIISGTVIMRFTHPHFSAEKLEAHLKDSNRPHV